MNLKGERWDVRRLIAIRVDSGRPLIREYTLCIVINTNLLPSQSVAGPMLWSSSK